ncbi:MAG: hypothetical protein OWS74_05785, partial [Firmicutes bacterium]|nr:hypothetical protein [Bacillota bacterium]
VSGGETMDTKDGADLYSRVVKEYQEYFTPKKGTPSGNLAAAKQQWESAHQKLNELQESMRQAQKGIEHSESLDKELKKAQKSSQDSQHRRQHVQEQKLKADALAAQKERTQLQYQLSQAQWDTLQHVQESRTAQRQRQQALQQKILRLKEEENRLQQELAEGDQDLMAAKASRKQFESQWTAQKRELEQAEQAVKYFREKSKEKDLSDQLQAIYAENKREAELQQEYQNIVLTDQQLKELEMYQKKESQAQVRLKVDVPHVRVQTRQGYGIRVGPGTQEGGQDQTYDVQADMTIDVPNVAVITVSPGSNLAEMQRLYEKARDELAALCEKYHVKDIGEAQQLFQRKQQIAQELDNVKKYKKLLLQGKDFSEMERQAGILKQSIANFHLYDAAGGKWESVDQAERCQQQCFERVQRAQETYNECHSAQQLIENQQSVRREAIKRNQAEMMEKRQEADRYEQDLLQESGNSVDDVTLAKQMDEQAGETKKWQDQLQSIIEQLKAMNPDAIALEWENIQRVVEKQAENIRRIREEQVAVQSRLDAAVGNNLYDRLAASEAEEQRTREKFERINIQAQAAKYLFDVLSEARETVQKRYRKPLEDKVAGLGRMMFGSDFSVELNADLTIAQRRMDGQTLPFSSLSIGAKEQLTLLMRIAAAQLVAKDGGMPIILDDALGSTDAARLEKMGMVLNFVGNTCQIVALTCTAERYQWIGSATMIRIDPPGAVPAEKS